MKDDLGKAYGEYDTHWQVIGWAIPIVGFLLFVVSVFMCQTEMELDYSEFELAIKGEGEVIKNQVAVFPGKTGGDNIVEMTGQTGN